MIIKKIVKKVLLLERVKVQFEKVFEFYVASKYPENLKVFPYKGKIEDDKLCVAVCRRNLIDMKSVLDKIGVRFWLYYGVFLGAYRDGALISYDKDIDLAVCVEDRLRIIYFEDEFKKFGFKRIRFTWQSVLFYRDGVTIVLLFFRNDGNKRVSGFYQYDVDAFEVYNEVYFLDRSWRIFSEPEKWLKYIYGEDWRIPQKGKPALKCPRGR